MNGENEAKCHSEVMNTKILKIKVSGGSSVHSVDEIVDITKPFLPLVVQDPLHDHNDDDHDDHDTNGPHYCDNYDPTAVTTIQATLVFRYNNIPKNDIRFVLWR